MKREIKLGNSGLFSLIREVVLLSLTRSSHVDKTALLYNKNHGKGVIIR